jgi:hypothetical protein
MSSKVIKLAENRTFGTKDYIHVSTQQTIFLSSKEIIINMNILLCY